MSRVSFDASAWQQSNFSGEGQTTLNVCPLPCLNVIKHVWHY